MAEQSRDRLLAALNHTEPDMIPLDLGGTHVTGIAIHAYRRMRVAMGLPEVPAGIAVKPLDSSAAPLVDECPGRRTSPSRGLNRHGQDEFCDLVQQLSVVHDDVVQALGVDVRGLYPLCYSNIPLPGGSDQWKAHHRETADGWEYRDEWGFLQYLPKQDPLYYSIIEHPLDGMDVEVDDITRLAMPTGDEPWRLDGLAEQADTYRNAGFAVAIKSVCAGLVEMGERIRGMENFLVDLLANEEAAQALLDRILEVKMRFWTLALERLGDKVDVVLEMDDYGTQESQLVAPDVFRKLVKPRYAQLFSHIRKVAPHAKIMFHSCGSVRPIIPDFIEMGVDILNPVHIAARGMEPVQLKKDFGDALCFWGGGVETQGILPNGTPQQVRDDVKRNIDALAPGGGFVFATVHNIQADVPPENLAAMWDTLARNRAY